jgi:class 3 adenylate cyclase
VRRLPLRSALAAGLFLLALAGLGAQAAPPLPGGMELPGGWAPDQGGAIELDHGWRFVWNRLVPPEDQNDAGAAALAAESRPLQPSQSWNSRVPGYPDLPAGGYGTYLLRLRLPADGSKLDRARLALEIGMISSAARVFWNGKPIGGFGRLGVTESGSTPDVSTAILDLPAPSDPDPAAGAVWLAVQVSNWEDNFPGLQSVPRIASHATLDQARALSIATTFIMAGLFLIMAVYHLFLFLFRTEERAPLYFAVICLLLCVRILVTDQLYAKILAPGLPMAAVWAASYLTFALLVAAFALFTTNLFRYAWSPVIRWVAFGGSLLYAAVVAATPSAIYKGFMMPFQIFCLAVGLTLAVLVGIAIAGRRQHAVLFALGLLAVLGATVFDILKTNLQWPYPGLVPVGMVVFVFVLALVITRKTSQHLATAERLNHRLQKINNSMVRFVPRGFLQLEKRPDITEVALGDNSRDMVTVLDARYRPAGAGDPAAELERLNGFCSYMAPIVRKHGGTVIGFRADGLEAAFPGEIAQAIDAALEMVNTLAEPESRLTIGLAHGPVLMATIGEHQQMEAAMFSETVQEAAGLARLGRSLGAGLLVSGPTVQRIKRPENYQFRVVGNFSLAEGTEARPVAEFFDSDHQDDWRLKRETKKGFELAVHLGLLGRRDDARQAFGKHLTAYPGDRAARWHLDQITKLP